MRISDLSTDRALDVLCELVPYVSNITSDETLMDTLSKGLEFSEDMNLYGQFALLAGRVSEITPILLKTHRNDVYGILSVVNERTAADIAAQPVSETFRQLKDAFQDSELVSFFKSYMQRVRTERSAPSALSPDSE